MKDPAKVNMKFTLLFWVLLFAAAMPILLKLAWEKDIVIADVTREQTGSGSANASWHSGQNKDLGMRLLLQESETRSKSFKVPLSEGTRAEDVVMEKRYMEGQLWIYIEGVQEDFYREKILDGDVSVVTEAYCEPWKNGVILKLHMSEVLEYHSTMEENALTVAYKSPQELYDTIIVIDPAGGGSESGITYESFSEKDLALRVAELLQQETVPSNVKLYFTRLEDVDVTREQRLSLIENAEADFFLRIGAWEDAENPQSYGIQSFYNESYYIPGFGNLELADTVTRQVTISASNRAAGVFASPQGSILDEITIPAAQLSLGYLSNPEENRLLQQESYQQRLAEGIADAISKICEERDKE